VGRTTILFGPPGTGKTTSLLAAVDDAIHQGIDPDRIAFMSFSREAANVAVSRAAEKFFLSASELPHFRTLHSAAYRQLGLARGDVLGTAHFTEIGDAIGLNFRASYDEETERPVMANNCVGDTCYRIYSLARAKGTTLEDEWRLSEEADILLSTVRLFAATLAEYKRAKRLLDFNDMLDMAQSPLDVDLFIIDEAQDLTPAQWGAARRMGATAETVLLGGDDDQAIYSWAGADSSSLLRFKGARKVLPISYRLPRKIKVLADAIAARISARVPKVFSHNGSCGEVEWVNSVSDINLRDGKRWLLLARNRFQIAALEREARAQGVVYKSEGRWSNASKVMRAVINYEKLRRGDQLAAYETREMASLIADMQPPSGLEFYTWEKLRFPFSGAPDWMGALTRLSLEDIEYIRELRRNGESLSEPGRVVISTIHGAKGNEADNVFLMTDIAKRVWENVLVNPDDEQRVMYVAVSRAKEQLILSRPNTIRSWDLSTYST